MNPFYRLAPPAGYGHGLPFRTPALSRGLEPFRAKSMKSCILKRLELLACLQAMAYTVGQATAVSPEAATATVRCASPSLRRHSRASLAWRVAKWDAFRDALGECGVRSGQLCHWFAPLLTQKCACASPAPPGGASPWPILLGAGKARSSGWHISSPFVLPFTRLARGSLIQREFAFAPGTAQASDADQAFIPGGPIWATAK